MTLAEQHEAAIKQIEKLKGDLAAGENLVSESNAKTLSVSQELTDLKAIHATEVEALKAKLVVAESAQSDFEAKLAKAASDKALEITASAGVPPVAAATSDEVPQGREGFIAQYGAIKGSKEKAAFYAKHYVKFFKK